MHKQSIDSYLNIRNKDYYDHCYEILERHKVKSILDIGCATGDFAYCCNIDTFSWTCIDKEDELIQHAINTRCRSNIEFIKYDILCDEGSLNSHIKRKYCAVSLLGTLDTFENGRRALTRCVSYAEKLFIFHGKLNPYKFDVVIGHRHIDSTSDEYMYSHNTLSVFTMKEILKASGLNIVEFSEYMPNQSLLCDELSDSVKSFEINLNGKRALSNHLNMIASEYFVVALRA